MGQGRVLAVAAVVGFGWAFIATAARQSRRIDLSDCVVVVTGGGRGLGFAIAREFVRRGADVAICGRDADEVGRAADVLRQLGGDVMGLACDASNPLEVEEFFDRVIDRFGRIDVLVNNAGQCYVGPAAELESGQVEDAMRNIFWVQVYPTIAVLPHMRARKFGRIVHVSSIGGKIPLAHMAAYAAAKHAVTGWSESLAVELDKEGILVTTIAPPPLRDGAALYGHFGGRSEQEFRWFTTACNMPLLSSTAERTAKAVVEAAQHGDAERDVSFFSWFSARAQGLAPTLMSGVMRIINRMLPEPAAAPYKSGMRRGGEILESSYDDSIAALGALTRNQARAYRPAEV
ncbi:MAG TPA: SDR family NAD(P)-dependent oxidoreductase [Burkholderiales bacterium]|nr:SDR family NAD(P)-dependent oxidoreductase [Burkholderiales bacterium]